MEQIQLTNFEKKIVEKCVNGLREFGYPNVTKENIFTDYVYSAFFMRMLSDNEGISNYMDGAIARIKSLIKTNQ